MGFPNGPFFRYGNFFIPRVEKASKMDEEIFIAENHGPFGNRIPVRVNQAIFLFPSGFLDTYLHYIKGQ